MAAVVMGGLNTDGLSKYVRRLAGERVFGNIEEDGYKSAWMERGNEMDNPALDAFEFAREVTVLRQQHVDHPTIPNVAATPDGLMVGEYVVEAKSPMFHTWAETREAVHRGKRGLAAIPSEYRHQCRWQCWCCGVTDGFFVSYHPVATPTIVPFTVTQDEFDAMAERVVVVEGLIRNWIEIFQQRTAA
jgi:hypothetical protein